jgi:hypothetical protein
MADLPNEDREHRYVATGPNQGTSVRGVTGFYTDASLLSFGVNAQGTHCGVYGESVVNRPERTPPFPGNSNVNIGVCGVGLTYGVFGDGGQNAGVYGQHVSGGAGVIGLGETGDVTGVIGASKASLNPEIKAASSGVGIKGMSDAGHGVGVVGLSISDFAVRDIPTPAGIGGDGTGIGVLGESGSGTGVFGKSRTAAGVEGNSDTGIAVVGRSGSGAGAFFTSLSNDAVVGLTGGSGNGVRGSTDSGAGVRGVASGPGRGLLGIAVGGPGVQGQADTGVGVFGVSEKAAGVTGHSKSATQPGVFGLCENFTGVAGRSTIGLGVFGESIKQAGVVGRSTESAGVFGFGDAKFQLPAPPAGVFGVNDKSVGVLGSSLEVIGVWGNTNQGLGVVGTTSSGNGVPADRITDQGIGVIGLATSGVGAAGMSVSGTGVFGSSASGLAAHFKGPVTIEGDLTVIGAKSAGVPHPDGSHRRLYCLESPENWFEDFGEARLVDGTAEVRLDPGFAVLVDVDVYHVFLTPYGESNGMFVTERSATGFRVREQKGGTSDAPFAYRVVAKRKDIAASRLATVTLPAASSERQLPDLGLKISTSDVERLSVIPFDPPTSELGSE